MAKKETKTNAEYADIIRRADRLKDYDDKRVRIETTDGQTFEGICEYCSDEYCFHEYGRNEECLDMHGFLFFGTDIKDITLIDRYEAPFGLLEELIFQEGAESLADALEDADEEFQERLRACRLHYEKNAGTVVDPGVRKDSKF